MNYESAIHNYQQYLTWGFIYICVSADVVFVADVAVKTSCWKFIMDDKLILYNYFLLEIRMSQFIVLHPFCSGT